MFRPAVVATVLTSMILIGLLVSAVQVWQPPGASENALHSYSARAIGYRALYETLEALGTPVSRSWATPEALFQGRTRILLLQPDLYLLEREKQYLERFEDWLLNGGEVVIASRDLSFVEDNPRFFDDQEKQERAQQTFGYDRLPSVLGVEGLRVEPVYYDDESDDIGEERARGGYLNIAAPPEYEYEPSYEGTLKPLEQTAAFLDLPGERLRWFEGEPIDRAAGQITIEADVGVVPIALEFERGRGRVVLVAEPTLFNNIGLGSGDNAALAYHLAVGANDRPVVFDEYYHGALTGIGPVALLGIFPYGAIGVFVLFATLLWAWSNGVRFGPPVDTPPESRRNILEYVDAMAHLFRRGGKGAFVLRVNREGLLDELRRELRLPSGSPSDVVRHRLRQANEARGRRLDEVLNEVDRALVSARHLSETELNHFQERLETCRTSKAPNPLPRKTAS
ncbi:MAG: DUF4350 domain-containing protein [FCB group bacterium]|jgi:hypothetical protein|nr:DUF4350 domain-containing protein [FCB group bacterium]